MAVADNGKEALERITQVAENEERGYDVILMDLEMPSKRIVHSVTARVHHWRSRADDQ